MVQELETIKNPYDVWWVLHRAILRLATREESIRFRVAFALIMISPLKSDDFPPDMRSDFSTFEANLEAQTIAEPRTGSRPLDEFEQLPEQDHGVGAMVRKLSVPTCYEIAKEIALLYDMLSQMLIQGGGRLNA